ncbi:hypothetical protein E4U42_000234, partial [Claviceps africana]
MIRRQIHTSSRGARTSPFRQRVKDALVRSPRREPRCKADAHWAGWDEQSSGNGARAKDDKGGGGSGCGIVTGPTESGYLTSRLSGLC